MLEHTTLQLSKNLLQSISAYIEENFVPQPLHRKKSSRSCLRGAEFCESCAGPEERFPCPPMAAPRTLSLEEMLRQADAGFTETLLNLIDKTGKKDSEIYKKANISKQHFSKIRNNPAYKPTKPTAIALALALELSLEDTKDLIGRAGYALTNSSKFDLIVRYFIEHGNYNIVEINLALYEFDQVLLGNEKSPGS